MGFSRLRHSRAMSVLSANLSTFPSFSITALGCYRLTWTCIHATKNSSTNVHSKVIWSSTDFLKTGSYSLRPIFLKLPLSSRIDMPQKNVLNDLMVRLLLHCWGMFFSSLCWWSCPIVITIWGCCCWWKFLGRMCWWVSASAETAPALGLWEQHMFCACLSLCLQPEGQVWEITNAN